MTFRIRVQCSQRRPRIFPHEHASVMQCAFLLLQDEAAYGAFGGRATLRDHGVVNRAMDDQRNIYPTWT